MISVIVPVYNVEKYIEKCVESIIAQTYTDLEIILVDDGSTDNSGKLCDEYAKRDSRIRVVHKEYGGVADARNIGVECARGEYLAFVDSDDYAHPRMMEILYQNIKEYDADISMCSYWRVSENEKISFVEPDNKVEVVDKPLVELRINAQTISILWTKIYKKSLFNDVSFPIGKLHEDEFVIHELLFASKKMVKTTAKLYAYVKREGSITADFSIKRTKDALEAYQSRIDFFGRNNVVDMQKHAIEMLIYYLQDLFERAEGMSANDKKIVKTMIRKQLYLVFKSGANILTVKEKSKILVFYITPKHWVKYKSKQR